MSMLVSQPNSSVTSLVSERELEMTRTTLLTTPTAFSMGLVMRLSTSDGAVPSNSVFTVSDGYVISGSRSTARSRNATTPKTTAAMKKTRMVTGRRVEKFTIFIAAPSAVGHQPSA